MGEFVACSEGFVVEALDDGLVVYDPRSGQAHWLDRDAAAVWRACARPAGETHIAQVTNVPAPACAQTLERLRVLGLVTAAGGMSRRGALQAAARVGVAGAVGAPIVSALIPVAAAHASTGGGSSTGGDTTPPSPTTTFSTNGTFVLSAGDSVTYSLIGGGGGGGQGPAPGGAGGAISGTITNVTGSSQTLEIIMARAAAIPQAEAPGLATGEQAQAGAGAAAPRRSSTMRPGSPWSSRAVAAAGASQDLRQRRRLHWHDQQPDDRDQRPRRNLTGGGGGGGGNGGDSPASSTAVAAAGATTPTPPTSNFWGHGVSQRKVLGAGRRRWCG